MSNSCWPHELQNVRLLYYLPEFAQTHVHWVGDAIQPSHPLSPPSPPALIFPSIRVFSNEVALCIRQPKYWRFSISPSSEYSGRISFRIDCFDLHAVQGTLKSFLQHHSLKASILWLSAFFKALTSIHDYWKNLSFDYKDLCKQSGKFLLFIMRSRFVIAFLPRWKYLLFRGCSHHPQWFWSPGK